MLSRTNTCHVVQGQAIVYPLLKMELLQACIMDMDAACSKTGTFPLLIQWKYFGLALPYRYDISGSCYCGCTVTVIITEFQNYNNRISELSRNTE